ncbi:MAG: hypothetical protein ACQES8_07230 [Thermodesulfobacteriota bacterium]
MQYCTSGTKARLSLAITICLLVSGCSAPELDLSLKQPPFSEKKAPVRKVLDLTVGVETFVDLRSQIRGSENQKWLGYIPGVFWVDIASEMPEIYTAYSPYNSRPMKDTITEAIAAGLRDSGGFREVAYLPRDPYKKTDYHLEGVLQRSHVKERGYYYGSSVYAWLLRIIGLPYVSYEVILEADLRLRNMTTRKIIWRGKIKGKRTDKYNSIYQLTRGKKGKQLIAYNFSKILHKQLPRLIDDMIRTLEKFKDQD